MAYSYRNSSSSSVLSKHTSMSINRSQPNFMVSGSEGSARSHPNPSLDVSEKLGVDSFQNSSQELDASNASKFADHFNDLKTPGENGQQ
jgi:hypothetical protein